jgi:putative aldouronate transport system permease protein
MEQTLSRVDQKDGLAKSSRIKASKKPSFSKAKMKRYLPLFLMTVPGLLYLIINNYIPMVGIIIAFKNINYQLGILQSPWVGLDNFKFLFMTSDAWVITRNTILYNIEFIILTTVFGIAIAIMLNEIVSRFFLRFYQTIILLPFMMSMVIVSYLVYAVLSPSNGLMNMTILPLFGMKAIDWYSSPEYWPIILTIVRLWTQIGFLCIIYLSSIVGIDKEYYEAARMDGATKWQQITKITLPLLSPIITMMVLFSIGKIFYSDFGLFYQVPMNSGMLYSTTNVIDTYVYRGLMQLGDIGMSSAAGFYQSLVGFILVFLSNYIVNKINSDNALF